MVKKTLNESKNSHYLFFSTFNGYQEHKNGSAMTLNNSRINQIFGHI